MISVPHRVLFVHIPKCGGQSVEQTFLKDIDPLLEWQHRYLLGCFGRPSGKGWPRDMPARLAHLKAHEYLLYDMLPRPLFESYLKFAIIRDPVERTVSMWKYKYLQRGIGIDAFIDQHLPREVTKNYWFSPQRDFVCAPDTGELLVDHVLRFSELETAFARLPHGVRVPLQRRNVSKVPDPPVSSAARSAIVEIYRADYERFDAF